MRNQYYNTNEFSKILSLIDINPFEAKRMYEGYLIKYPQDYSAYSYYSNLLVTLGKLDEAEKIINDISGIILKKSKLNNDINRRKILECKLNFTRLRLLSYKKQYEDLYSLTSYPFNQIAQDLNIDALIFLCKKNNGTLKLNRDNINSYLFRQIYEYRECDFIEHITKHMADYNQNIDDPNKVIFVPEFPINEIINEIKKYIPSNKRLLPGFFENTYFFKYDGCGRVNYRLVDYFKVVCFHDTNNFITMHPTFDCKNLPYVDLNYLKKDNNPIIKRKSRIEIFNQKYERN